MSFALQNATKLLAVEFNEFTNLRNEAVGMLDPLFQNGPQVSHALNNELHRFNRTVAKGTKHCRHELFDEAETIVNEWHIPCKCTISRGE